MRQKGHETKGNGVMEECYNIGIISTTTDTCLRRLASSVHCQDFTELNTPAATSAQVTAGVTPSPVVSPPDAALLEKWEEAAEKAVGAILSAMEQSQRGLVSGLIFYSSS